MSLSLTFLIPKMRVARAALQLRRILESPGAEQRVGEGAIPCQSRVALVLSPHCPFYASASLVWAAGIRTSQEA